MMRMIGNSIIKENDEYIDLIVNEYLPEFRQKHSNEYEIIYQLINLFRICEKQLEGLEVNRKNKFILASIMQLNKLYQSSVILFERGLKESANIIIRSILELSLKLISVIHDENFLDILLNDEAIEFKKLLNEIKENKFFDMIPKKIVDEYIKTCEENIDINIKEKPRVYKMASNNNLKKVYIFYRLQCDYTHQNTNIVAGIVKETDKVCYVDGNFQLEDFKFSVAYLISITIIAFPVIINEYLKNDNIKQQYDLFMENFEKSFKDLI